MSTYVMSDIHGRLDLFEEMLEKIQFDESRDMLYVLGDFIDRGGGLGVAKKLMQMDENDSVVILPGNHEVMFYGLSMTHCSYNDMANKLYEQEKIQRNSKKRKNMLEDVHNNDNPTFADLMGTIMNFASSVTDLGSLVKIDEEINQSIRGAEITSSVGEFYSWQDFDIMTAAEQKKMLKWLESFIYKRFERIEVHGKRYILVHGGVTDGSEKFKKLGDLEVRDDFFMNPVDRIALFCHGAPEDTTVIFGHTTTRDINILRNGTYVAPCKIWHDDKYHDKIGIDCGAAFPNGQLGCLRLDDMQEFYVKNERKFITPIEDASSFMETANDVIGSVVENWGEMRRSMSA